jgi:tetratricopeptide (TPR) repeat protein
MFAGRYQDAEKTLLAGIAFDEKEGSGEQAQKLVALAETYLVLGRKTAAANAALKAVQANAINDGIHFLAARVLVEAGEDQQAEKLAKDLEAKLQKQTKSLALMIRGDIALKRNQLAEAVDTYREAQAQHDSWISHLLLGRAYVEVGHFPEALTQLEAAEKRAGEATDLFDANSTTLHYLPPLHYWLGRAREGLGSLEAARKSYQGYLLIRAQADPADKLVADVKRRG